MVSVIASLPEVFAVTPNVTVYTARELEQRQLAYYMEVEQNQDPCYSYAEPEQCPYYPEDEIPMCYTYHVAGLTSTETLSALSFVNSDFMRTVRETLHLNDIHNEGITGAGVRVAVIDTGIDHTHPEFRNFLDENGRIRGRGRPDNTFSDHPDHRDRNHGTGVSGAVIGVAPGIELWHYRIGGLELGPGMHPIEAIEAAYNDGMDVVNMSIGTGAVNPFDPINHTVNTATLGGMIMVSAVGNYGNTLGYFATISPGNATLGIAVGASYTGGVRAYQNNIRRDIRTSYSSRGPSPFLHHIKPDILAPSGVYTTNLYGGYMLAGGTSYAAPIVAGIAALLLERFPDATPLEIKARIMNTARQLEDQLPNSVFAVGAGFVQPREALRTETMVTVEHYVPFAANLTEQFQPATMASLSFGMLNVPFDEGINETMPVSIRNMGNSTVTYTVSYMFTRNNSGAASIGLSSASITVAPGSTGQFNVTMLVDGNVPRNISAGEAEFYEGYIYVRNGATVVARLPFGAAAMNTLFRIYTEQEFLHVLRYQHVAPIVIEVAADFNLEHVRVFPTDPAMFFAANNKVTIRSADGYIRTIVATLDQHVFRVHGSLTLENINIVNGDQRSGHGFAVDPGGHLRILNGATISGNMGAGVLVDRGNLTMYGGEISGNRYRGVLLRNGTFNMHGGVIHGNSINGIGGGVQIQIGTFNMYGGEISGNSSSHYGGGVDIWNWNATFNMYGGEISDNISPTGGGIVIRDGTFNMHGGEISGNTAISTGGGVSVSSGRFNMYGGHISGNNASNGGGIGLSIESLRSGMLRIGSRAVFSHNSASNTRNPLPEDVNVHTSFIHTTQWTQPFTQGFNNFDIQYMHGTHLQMRRLTFQLNGTSANPTTPQQISFLSALPGARIMRANRFPANPTRLGYRFAGWYLDGNLTQRLTLEAIMPNTDINLHARWIPIYVIFHFDNQVVQQRATNGYINTSQIPTPATRYGRPGAPGWAHMGWFTRIFDNMHYTANPNRAFAFDLTQRITHDITDEAGHLHLHASFLRHGDVNGDGWIDPVDRTLVQNILLGLSLIPHYAHRQTADVDVDGWVTPVDRSLLNNHILGAPGVVLGVPDPNIILGSYMISFNFDMQTIDIPIANGRIDTARITEEELLIWEMELLNFLYTTSGRSGRAAGLLVYVNELHSGNSYMLELDTSAFNMNMPTLALEISTLEQEISAMATGTRR